MDANDNPAPPGPTPLSLPPVFEAVHVTADAFTAARGLAVGGGDAGTLVVAALDPGTAWLEVAVILEPDRPAADCFPALPIAMLAMADALAALGPPLKTIGFSWPDRLLLDGAELGRARLALPKPSAEPLPAWLVAAIMLRWRFESGSDEPGRTPDRTALLEEGFGAVTPAAIVEAFARHLLFWVGRWQEDGLAEATSHYRARLVEPAPASVRFDPANFDLCHRGPPPSCESLAERLLLGPTP
jgi:hypothetical protein